MKNKFISLALAGILVIGITSSFAVEDLNNKINEDNQQSEVVNYTKYKYVNQVLEDNLQIKQAEEKLEDERMEYVNSLRIRDGIKELSWDDFNENYDDNDSKYVAEKAKKYNFLKEGKEYHIAYIDTKKVVDSVRLNAEATYYNYINAQKNYESAKKQLDLVKEKYDSKILEKNIGQISSLELLEYQKTFNDTQVDFMVASNELIKAKNQFNMLVDKPINREVNVKNIDIDLPEFELKNIDETLKSMLENSYQISGLELELERLNMDRVMKSRHSGFTSVKLELERNKIDIENATEDLKDAKWEVEYQLRSNYNDVKAEYNKFKSAQIQLDIDSSNLEVAKIQHKTNMISELDYLTAKNDYVNAYTKYLQAKLNAYIKITEFNNFIELNTNPVPMEKNSWMKK